jgi:hypothetical protein
MRIRTGTAASIATRSRGCMRTSRGAPSGRPPRFRWPSSLAESATSRAEVVFERRDSTPERNDTALERKQTELARRETASLGRRAPIGQTWAAPSHDEHATARGEALANRHDDRAQRGESEDAGDSHHGVLASHRVDANAGCLIVSSHRIVCRIQGRALRANAGRPS